MEKEFYYESFEIELSDNSRCLGEWISENDMKDCEIINITYLGSTCLQAKNGMIETLYKFMIFFKMTKRERSCW